LITDSAYASAEYSEHGLDWVFARDPERRRLDLRVLPATPGHPNDAICIARAYRDKIIRDRNHHTLRKKIRERPNVESLIGAVFFEQAVNLSTAPLIAPNHWEEMDERLTALSSSQATVFGAEFACDWSALSVDFWSEALSPNLEFGQKVPLLATVYHDSVVMPVKITTPDNFFDALLTLSPPLTPVPEAIQAILCPLHRLTFPAFLVHYEKNNLKERAIYSNKTEIEIDRDQQRFRVTHPEFSAYNDTEDSAWVINNTTWESPWN
jgi:hypothetical protein